MSEDWKSLYQQETEKCAAEIRRAEQSETDMLRMQVERDETLAELARLRSIIDAGRAAHSEDRARADTLMRERDEARRLAQETASGAEWRARCEQADAARERVEADNAVLVARLQAVCDAAMQTDWIGPGGEREARFPWDEIEFALRDLHQNHPGAALLERLQALTIAVDKVREYVASALKGPPSGLKTVAEHIASLLPPMEPQP